MGTLSSTERIRVVASVGSIPYRDTSLPPARFWEYKEANRRAEQRSISPDDETAVFSPLNEMRALEAEAAAKCKSARRSEQWRRMRRLFDCVGLGHLLLPSAINGKRPLSGAFNLTRYDHGIFMKYSI